MTKQIEVFKLSVPDIDIADLRERLRHTRFPDQAPGPAWAYGTDVAWMRGLIDHWGEKFDWRTQEARPSQRLPAIQSAFAGHRGAFPPCTLK
jgi:hypothetical protein